MKKKPIVSVILSVFNADIYLAESIESILSQSFVDFEFIIINDGSTDNSLAIIEEYQQKDQRIILINRKNKGLIHSLNEGIERSTGKYILRMDADDISHPDRISIQVEFMDKHPSVVICGSWVEHFDGESRIIKYPISDNEIKEYFIFQSPFAHPAVIMKSETFHRKNGVRYNEKYQHAEDYKLWFDLMPYGKFANIPQCLLRYRVSSNQITAITKRDCIAISIKIRREYINAIFKRYKVTSLATKITLREIKQLQDNKNLPLEIKKRIIYVCYLSLDKYSIYSFFSFSISLYFIKSPYYIKDYFRVLYYQLINHDKWI